MYMNTANTNAEVLLLKKIAYLVLSLNVSLCKSSSLLCLPKMTSVTFVTPVNWILTLALSLDVGISSTRHAWRILSGIDGAHFASHLTLCHVQLVKHPLRNWITALQSSLRSKKSMSWKSALNRLWKLEVAWYSMKWVWSSWLRYDIAKATYLVWNIRNVGSETKSAP